MVRRLASSSVDFAYLSKTTGRIVIVLHNYYSIIPLFFSLPIADRVQTVEKCFHRLVLDSVLKSNNHTKTEVNDIIYNIITVNYCNLHVRIINNIIRLRLRNTD